jgi:hypothetical protein
MNLHGEAKFMFFTMMQAALKMRQMGKNREDFLLFAKEIWVSMEMNDEKSLRRILQEGMMNDIINHIG